MTRSLRSRLEPLVENVGESATACLLAMVQGSLLAVTLTHWAIAARTGIVDYAVHPGNFGAAWTEAALTGLGAAALSALVGAILRRREAARRAAARP